jgi:hypothetical protein
MLSTIGLTPEACQRCRFAAGVNPYPPRDRATNRVVLNIPLPVFVTREFLPIDIGKPTSGDQSRGQFVWTGVQKSGEVGRSPFGFSKRIIRPRS